MEPNYNHNYEYNYIGGIEDRGDRGGIGGYFRMTTIFFFSTSYNFFSFLPKILKSYLFHRYTEKTSYSQPYG